MNGAPPLPTVLAEIADAAGIEAAISLARAYGGQTVYVPARPKPDHWLVDTVGLEAAGKICDLYRVRDGGARLLIPLARPTLLAAALARGASARSAAAAVGVHERTAFRMRSRMRRSDDRQGDLFTDNDD